MTALQKRFKTELHSALGQRLGISNPMAVPRLKKIVISMGLGRGIQDKKVLVSAERDLAAISGQKPVIRKARVSVSNFKLREGMEIGAMVTLRERRMWEFLERLIHTAIPRLRDFRGLKTTFDGRGNYSMGISDQSIFPEIDLDSMEHSLGMNITFVTTAGTDAQGRALLEDLGMPFRKSEAKG